MQEINTQRLENFAARFTRLIESQPKESTLLSQGRELLHDLVKQDDWLDLPMREPHAVHYQQYLLYLDPKERFSVVSFVWGPGQSTPIHDHTVWGLIGMLVGSEKCQPYSRMSDGRWVPAGLQLDLLPGDVEVISPRLGDVHKVWNAFLDQSSISIHVYGGNIGRISRHVYQLDGQMKDFISGYSPVPRSVSPSTPAPMPLQGSIPNLESNIAKPAMNSPPSSTADLGAANAPQQPLAPPSAVKSWMSKKAIDQVSALAPKASAQVKNLTQEALLGLAPVLTPDPVVLASNPMSHQLLHPSSVSNSVMGAPDHQPNTASTALSSNSVRPSQTVFASNGSGLSIRARPDSLKPAGTSPNIAPSFASTNAPTQQASSPQNAPLNQSAGTTPSRSVEREHARVAAPHAVQTWTANVARPVPAVVSPNDSPLSSQDPSHCLTHPHSKTALWVRERLLARQEVALIDLREEDPFARGHPLFAAQMSISRVEIDAYRRLPCLESPIVLYHDEVEVATRVQEILLAMGYKAVYLLDQGLRGWHQAGQEMFIDVNVPSKAFGEWVAAQKHTPHVSATQLKFWLDQNADLVVLDARRFEEYQTMSIPKATSVPGAELVLRARTLAPRVTTRIVVNCAGRTRSIIGAQSLLNAGIPNPVCALENGTIGWVLAGQALETGCDRTFGAVNDADLMKAKMSALALAIRAGVKRIDLHEFQALSVEVSRTTYLFDVRSLQEFEEGHLPKAVHAPGGQLVQETDHFAPVRGARVVLYDTDGVRAMMSASWLAQMAWEVYVIKDVRLGDLTRKDTRYLSPRPASGECTEVTPEVLKEWLGQRNNLTMVIDVSSSAHYVKRHIPGAWWLLRSRLKQDFNRVHKANRYVLTSEDGLSARYAWQELSACVKANVEVFVLVGGTQAWSDLGFSLQQGESYLASPRIDRYQRPYEGVENSAQAMQAYLDWEFGLVEQLRKDGTHHFRVV